MLFSVNTHSYTYTNTYIYTRKERARAMKVITIANQKGGVGKTTTAHALIDGLTQKGFKVLGIDLDGQCNLSLATGASTKGATALGVLTGELNAESAIQHTERADIIAASTKLTNADALIETGEELKAALEPIAKSYDYCIIDTPPMLCSRTLSALIASNAVVIPARADLYSLQGIDELADTITGVQATRNKGLKVAGILLTAYKSRTALHKEIIEPMTALADDLDSSLFKATIRDSVAVSEAPFMRTGLFTYAPRAKVTEDYKAFIEELLERI